MERGLSVTEGDSLSARVSTRLEPHRLEREASPSLAELELPGTSGSKLSREKGSGCPGRQAHSCRASEEAAKSHRVSECPPSIPQRLGSRSSPRGEEGHSAPLSASSPPPAAAVRAQAPWCTVGGPGGLPLWCCVVGARAKFSGLLVGLFSVLDTTQHSFGFLKSAAEEQVGFGAWCSPAGSMCGHKALFL